MLKLVIGAVVGVGLGAWMGSTRRCETGACPLTSNPYLGAVYGGLMGLMIASTLSAPSAVSNARQNNGESNMAATTTSNILEISTREAFQAQVLQSGKPVLVDLWATWCAPCRAQLPIVEQVAQSAGDHARVVKINVDEAEELAAQLRVSSIPTLLVFKDGREQHRMVGVQSAQTLLRALGI